jgi:hypothetical protein
MKCTETRSLFSPYLDGTVTGNEMRAISEHLDECAECSTHYALLKDAHSLVSALGRRKAPPELQLRLRVAISREIARSRHPWYEGLVIRVENAAQAFMVPATAGLAAAIVIFGLLIGFFALPQQLQASDSDVPTALYTPPELTFSPIEAGLTSINADSVVVEAYVDVHGRVEDYRILSAPRDAQALIPEISNVLIFTQFHPAMSFGRPTPGRAVLSFSKINVKG